MFLSYANICFNPHFFIFGPPPPTGSATFCLVSFCLVPLCLGNILPNNILPRVTFCLEQQKSEFFA